MENKVKLLIEIGLQRDEDNGDVSIVAFDVPDGVAERVCEEQEKCTLLNEGGELTKLLNAYAVVNGYERAYFISASMVEDSDEEMSENAELREMVLFLQGELEEMTKNRNAHELAGKLFEMKNTSLEKKLEKAAEELDIYKKWCQGLQEKYAIAVGYINAGLPENAAAIQAEGEMWMKLALGEKDKIRNAIRRMRDELKAVRVHIDGISLKAIPFETVDAVAERVMAEMEGD